MDIDGSLSIKPDNKYLFVPFSALSIAVEWVIEYKSIAIM
jgi:hypothetical protein